MNNLGVYSRTFTVAIGGLGKLSHKEIVMSEKHLTITWKPSDDANGEVTIQIGNTTQDEGKSHAMQIMTDLFDALLLRYAEHISEAVAPKPGTATFVNAEGRQNQIIEVPTGHFSSVSTTGHPLSTPREDELDEITRRVGFRFKTPSLSTSADLYSAKQMFSIGMQAENEVVRFLILYSVVALAALFKWHDGKQENVDKLLQDATPSLVRVPTGRNGKMETLYTRIRNDLIHAEGRGKDPSKPIQEIRQHLKDFQRDVAAVLNMLYHGTHITT